MTDASHQALPRYADTVIVGGGTAGAVVAGLLAAGCDESVLLLEAGPDYGPLAGGRWPLDLVDARALGYSDTWQYDSGDTYADRLVPFERAKVIGGCSSHNGCAAIWGSRLDYDGWAAAGNPGWSAAELLPLFQAAAGRLRVRRYAPHEVTPFQSACLAAAAATGLPHVDDLNDLDQDEGVATSPVNIHDGVRWNTAFAYLDHFRDRPNLTIRDRVTVDRLVVTGNHVVAVEVVGENGTERIEAGRVVVSGGTYGSPAVLLRSGIGDPDELTTLGIEPSVALPGVGRNLHDHPSVIVGFAETPELERRTSAFAAERWLPEEQVIAKARSPRCAEGFDLHLYPVGGPAPDAPAGWRWKLPMACMTPRSRGHVRLRSADPTDVPRIDHRYLSDPDGEDRRVLIDGIGLAREVAAQPPLRDLLGAESTPGPNVRSRRDLERFVDANCVHYYHPVGTCAMGPAADLAAVVDPRGQIHGLANAFVADCSIMPVIPRANTNLPAVVVGERIGRWLLGER
ncbi:MAG: Oxidoreductase, GMC family [uncultured Thermomicrobiales bacterium]|uniref:Oxidoreductase, GMC family n=1 Tax=uncultured Thermomicrobiales bacterium TaxID=1645740 RepID=A0A6J4VUE4_9BACT|nr:MAG: Oxidoreductase, GMC family [uncultured Thermomicrobiales bacterium]